MSGNEGTHAQAAQPLALEGGESSPAGTRTATASLLAILRENPEQRVLGQAYCHGVYAQIHVVDQGGRLGVYGNDCFTRLFGHRDALGSAIYGGGESRTLTRAERDMLANNTAALIAKLEAERQALFAQARERQRKELEARQQREIEREPAQLA